MCLLILFSVWVMFIMSLVTTTTTTLVTVVGADTFTTTTMTVAVASTSGGLPGVLGWQDELPPPSFISKDTMKGIAGFLQCSSNNFHLKWVQLACCHSGLCQLCHGSFLGEVFFFRVEPLPHILCWSLFWHFFFYFLILMCLQLTPTCAQPFGFAYCSSLEHTHGRHICYQLLICGPYRSAQSRFPTHFFKFAGALCHSNGFPLQPFNQYGVQYSFGNSAESLGPSAIHIWWGDIFLFRFGITQ